MFDNHSIDWYADPLLHTTIGPDMWDLGLHAQLETQDTMMPSRYIMEHWIVPATAADLDQLVLTPVQSIGGADSQPQHRIQSVTWPSVAVYNQLLTLGHRTGSMVIDHAARRLEKYTAAGDFYSEPIEEFEHWPELHIPVNHQFLDYYSNRSVLSMIRYAVEHGGHRLNLTQASWAPPVHGAAVLDQVNQPVVAQLSLLTGQVHYYYSD